MDFFHRVAADLGWRLELGPESSPSILHLADLAKRKLEAPLSKRLGGDVLVSLLAGTSTSEAGDWPLAVVCRFRKRASDKELRIAQQFAWNFSRTPLLITVDPVVIRAWTCCEPPSPEDESPRTEIVEARISADDVATTARSSLLHWQHLQAATIFKRFPARFKPGLAASSLLLSNLKEIRRELLADDLPVDLAHDLLGRLIFVQFLFHRQDSEGRSALNTEFLRTLKQRGVVKSTHQSLSSILRNKADTYRFFKWLNERFQGDLFPSDDSGRDSWDFEESKVTQRHLELLADFLSGEVELKDGQQSFWPLYQFDAIPLEFISSIYQEFVADDLDQGAHYTPSHLADLVLDGALPWTSAPEKVKILDPSCGSGNFLVKAYQRLIDAWKKKAADQLRAETLRSLLEQCIFGVDINEHAIRVASFSLYLAMCDEIDPRFYWTKVSFPRLRNRNLLVGDFFSADVDSRLKALGTFTVVVGNPPWGRKTITSDAKRWSSKFGWYTAYQDIGPLFLAKATHVSAPLAHICMIQPLQLVAGDVGPAITFRAQLFRTYEVEEVINLAHYRFDLFEFAIAPSCVITVRNCKPSEQSFSYICPKPTKTAVDKYAIPVSEVAATWVTPREAIEKPVVWTALMWGSRRYLDLLEHLANLDSLASRRAQGLVTYREGVIRGDREKRQKKLKKFKYLHDLPNDVLTPLDALELPDVSDIETDSKASTDFSAFQSPQLLLKQSWSAVTGRFRAALNKSEQSILCSQNCVSVHAESLDLLRTAWMAYNSKFAVAYFLLTSSRFAFYRPELTVADLMGLPLPAHNLAPVSDYESLDRVVLRSFDLSAQQSRLFEELYDFALQDFKGGADSPGRQPVAAESAIMHRYRETIERALQHSFGRNDVFAQLTPFSVDSPAHAVTICFGLSKAELKQNSEQPRIPEVDVLDSPQSRIYTELRVKGKVIPCVLLVKPNESRHWQTTRALDDADRIAAEIISGKSM